MKIIIMPSKKENLKDWIKKASYVLRIYECGDGSGWFAMFDIPIKHKRSKIVDIDPGQGMTPREAFVNMIPRLIEAIKEERKYNSPIVKYEMTESDVDEILGEAQNG